MLGFGDEIGERIWIIAHFIVFLFLWDLVKAFDTVGFLIT